MAKIVVVTSGKGGVGKTTTSAAMAAGLAEAGHRTAVIDFDVGLRNLDLIMGCERRVVYDFVNVINGDANLNQALIKDKRVKDLFILPASQTRDKDALTHAGVERVLDELSQQFDYIICDSPAGIERGALMAAYFADEAIVVTNPEVSSVRDSDRVLGILASKTRRAEQGGEPISGRLLLTRYSPERVDRGDMLSVDDVGRSWRWSFWGDPGVAGGAQCLQRRHPGDPGRGLGCRPGLPGRGGPVPGRRAPTPVSHRGKERLLRTPVRG